MYLLDFWEENLPNQISDFFTNAKNYLVSIGLTIYDNLVSIIGETPAKMTIMVVVIATVLFVLLKLLIVKINFLNDITRLSKFQHRLIIFLLSLAFFLCIPKKIDFYLISLLNHKDS